MKRIFLIIKLIFRSKIFFREPKTSKLVIFDDESTIDINNLIKKFDHFMMPNRIHHINKIYLSFKLIKLFIKNYKGNIMTSYLVSLLEVIKPKAVVTFIDNSEKFSDLAKELSNKIKFVAIQNAYRFEIIENDYLYKIKKNKFNVNKYFYIPNLLCFGQHDIDLYKKYKIKVKKFISIGSLRLSNALEYIKKNKIKLKKSRYDVCVISDTASRGHFQNFARDDESSGAYFDQGMAHTAKYAIRFCMKNNKKFIFAMKSKRENKINQKKELNFYKKYLSEPEFRFLIANTTKDNAGKFISYIKMFESKVAISTISTMLGENLALGNKVFACNLTKLSALDFPNGGICSIKNCNYEKFEKKLLYILSINKKKYISKLSKDKNYIINYNKKISTNIILEKTIRQFIN